jgi:hypothetical protein
MIASPLVYPPTQIATGFSPWGLHSENNFVADHHEIFVPIERGGQHSLHHFEADCSFLQDLGALLKHKIFLAREVGPEFR